MSKKGPDIHTFSQETHDAIEGGNHAASIHDFSTTVSRYRRVFEKNDNYCDIYDATTIILTHGTFEGYTLHSAYIQDLLALNIKLSITYLRLEDHSRVHEWITLVLARINSYRQAARVPQQGAAAASIYTIVAQASEVLGLVEHAVGEMKEEMRHNSGGSRMATELVRLKNKIQSVEVKLEVLLAGLVVGVKHGAKQLRLVLHDHCSVSIVPSVVLSLPRDFGEWDDCQDL